MDKEEEVIFNEMYNSLYERYYLKYEEMRKDSKIDLIIATIAIAVSYFIFGNMENLESNKNIFSLISFLLLCFGIIFLRKGLKKRNNYKQDYKKEIIKEFINNLNFKYEPNIENKNEIFEQYERAKFDTLKYGEYNYDDHILGKIDNNITLDLYDVDNEVYTEKGGSYTVFARFIWSYKFT